LRTVKNGSSLANVIEQTTTCVELYNNFGMVSCSGSRLAMKRLPASPSTTYTAASAHATGICTYASSSG
jgi:hypothetical protein